jgi:hypothetical protein
MADSLEVILFVQGAVQESSWQTRENGGLVANAEIGITKITSEAH